MAENGRDTELVLPPGTYAFVLDGTKGHISAYCGPFKSSLSNTDSLVVYNATTKRFDKSSLPDAVQSNVICPKGCYVVLENPAEKGQPSLGRADAPSGPLEMGRTENLPGPQSFPLWPGQVATVVSGHHLRSNQYLVVRIADDEAAKKNWANSVVQHAAAIGAEVTSAHVLGIDAKTLVTGQTIIIKGTDVAFYIPPTGVEVLKEGITNSYIRDAETLERLEYAILLNENGNKEYRKGPDVVFPTPTQRFFSRRLLNPAGEDVEQRKFRAYELQPTNGLHIKVIADYSEQIEDRETKKLSTTEHKAGDEMFITGKDVAIYYPREEHAIISYGGTDKSYAVAIPSGEGRYVLDRGTGAIDLEKGPSMFLPDPIKQVIVRRVLSPMECELYYPNNREVREFNDKLRVDGVDAASDPAEINADIARNFVPARREILSRDSGSMAASYATSANLAESLNNSASPFSVNQVYGGSGGMEEPAAASRSVKLGRSASAGGNKGATGPGSRLADHMTRSTAYTPPRMITLDTKFDGAIRIDVWSGHAVQVVNSKGKRKTVIGPQTVLLEYDEYLERLSLSTGKPKSDTRKINTPYLRYISNPVSDLLTLKTQDLVEVSVHIKYLIRFDEVDSGKWFSMDNYVQYLVDHLRSMIGNAVRNISVREFYTNATNILRDIVLGTEVGDTGTRLPKIFVENGMVVYDLELIAVDVLDHSIASLLAKSRQETLTDDIALERIKLRTVYLSGQQTSLRDQMAEMEHTAAVDAEIKAASELRIAKRAMAEIKASNDQLDESAKAQLATAEVERAIAALRLEADRAIRDLDALYADAASKRLVEEEVGVADAIKTRLEAIAPGIIEALKSLALTGQLQAMGNLAPLSIIEGKSLSGTMETLFKNTPIEGLVENLKKVAIKA